VANPAFLAPSSGFCPSSIRSRSLLGRPDEHLRIGLLFHHIRSRHAHSEEAEKSAVVSDLAVMRHAPTRRRQRERNPPQHSVFERQRGKSSTRSTFRIPAISIRRNKVWLTCGIS
jgi:hypothetical protein